MIRLGICIICLFLAGPGSGAQMFHVPAKGAEPFRRDRLPIDVDRMSLLADELATLAAACAQRNSPGELRAAAQLLAISMALKPASREADELARLLHKGGQPKPPADNQLARASSAAWRLGTWLASEDAGGDANRLAACLGDALAIADPNHPRAAALRKSGEQGKWDGWIAGAAAFGLAPPDQPGPGAKDPEKPDPGHGTDPGTSTDTPAKDPVLLKLDKVKVAVPLYTYDAKTEKTSFGIMPVHLQAWSEPLPGPSADGEAAPRRPAVHQPQYLVGFPSELPMPALKDSFEAIRQAIQQRHGGLPSRGRCKFTLASGSDYLWPSNRDSVAGGVALLMDATLSGKAPGADVIVLGTIHSDGSMHNSWKTWERLRAMANNSELPGGRLILPRDAAPMLDAIIVLAKPDFFVRYEVLLAGSLSELAERATDQPADGLAAATAEFGEVRTASKGELIGPFLANRFVRERLTRILNAFPDHASARFALLQGSGDRPVRYTTPILASELRWAIEPMDWITRPLNEEYTTDQFTDTWKVCRERLDPLEDRVPRDDSKLWNSTFELIQSLRTLANTVKRDRQDTYYTRTNAREAFTELVKQHAALMQQLNQLTGEVQATPTPTPAPAIPPATPAPQ